MTVFNDRPHPWVLFESVPEPVFAEMKDLVPTWRRVRSNETVQEAEWDLLVTFGPTSTHRAKTMHVLSFGAEWASPGSGGRLRKDRVCHGTLVRVCPTAPKDVRRLLADSVAQNIDVESANMSWQIMGVDAWSSVALTEERPIDLMPLVSVGAERDVIAFETTRRLSTGEPWMMISLPDETTSHSEWLRAMLRRLTVLDPERFPSGPDWQLSPEYASPSIRKALLEQEALDDEIEQAADAFQARRIEIEARIESLVRESSEGRSRLLTGTGTPLVEAVAEALTVIGFRVDADMDKKNVARHKVRLEDLRLYDDDADGDWVCLVEVKGYSEGIKVTEIPKIAGRPAAQFAMDEGRHPEKVLFVANFERNTSPLLRQTPALDNPKRDLAALESYSGAAIDTRDLFRAANAVEEDASIRQDIKRSIVEARGLWAWPPPEE